MLPCTMQPKVFLLRKFHGVQCTIFLSMYAWNCGRHLFCTQCKPKSHPNLRTQQNQCSQNIISLRSLLLLLYVLNQNSTQICVYFPASKSHRIQWCFLPIKCAYGCSLNLQEKIRKVLSREFAIGPNLPNALQDQTTFASLKQTLVVHGAAGWLASHDNIRKACQLPGAVLH